MGRLFCSLFGALYTGEFCALITFEKLVAHGVKGFGALSTIINPAVVVHHGPSIFAAAVELRGAFKTTRLMIALNSC
jgi:hypothetical protein